MVAMKFEKKESLSREEAAKRLTEIAQAFAEGDEFKLERDGETIEFDVADTVTLEFELEIKDGETELELKWPASSASAGSRARSKASAD